ncbi:MAG: hypothetical protein HGB10_10750 [Coriobacteriia bacterium]|nr:hypothetical protein [Coriobacteriia bacterium]
MQLTIIALAAFTGVAVSLIVASYLGTYASTHRAVPVSAPVAPLDEAERLLARRYARDEITHDEYSRMLCILRR